jgi:uncharacterized protein
MPNDPESLPVCAGCGRCCHLVVELNPGTDVIPEDLVASHYGVRCMGHRGNGACVALHPVTNLCTIYEHRPKACRDFEWGSSLCRKAIAGLIWAPSGVSRASP